jgi:putative ABC transport system permease protein
LTGLSFHTDRDVLTVLKNELSSVPQIESITDTYFEPQYTINQESLFTEVEWQGKLQSDNSVFQGIPTDSRFVDTFRIKMLMGEWLDENGEKKIVLNEEAVRVMRLNEPIGAIIRMRFNNVMQEYTVTGVVGDFHTQSLRSRIYPTIFMKTFPSTNWYLRAVSGQEQEAIQRIKTILPEIDASLSDVHPTLLNELYDRLNSSEHAGLQLFSVLASVCLLISLFGIYAVAAASTLRRRKEIAIRKVVGAEAGDIVRMFFRDYTFQVILAGIVALPLGYYAMSRWLEGYAYRTNIPWWLLTGVITIVALLVLLTVLGQVLRAANSNPADVIKCE